MEINDLMEISARRNQLLRSKQKPNPDPTLSNVVLELNLISKKLDEVLKVKQPTKETLIGDA